jgi:hypothetical protein
MNRVAMYAALNNPEELLATPLLSYWRLLRCVALQKI